VLPGTAQSFSRNLIHSRVNPVPKLEEEEEGEVYSIQHYMIKFVSDWRQVGGFLPGTPISSTNKTDSHDITEILLKVALNPMVLILFLRSSVLHESLKVT